MRWPRCLSHRAACLLLKQQHVSGKKSSSMCIDSKLEVEEEGDIWDPHAKRAHTSMDGGREKQHG